LADALRIELRPWKIPVSLIEPGPIRTDMWGGMLDEYDAMTAQLSEEHRRLYAAHLTGSRKLLGRMQNWQQSPPDTTVAHNHNRSPPSGEFGRSTPRGHPRRRVGSIEGMPGARHPHRYRVAAEVSGVRIRRAQTGQLHPFGVNNVVAHTRRRCDAVVDVGGFHGVECSADEVVVSCPAGSPLLLHPNHPLANDDIDPDAERELQREGRIADSLARLDFLEANANGACDRTAAEVLLADRTAPLCVTPRQGRRTPTFGAVSFELGTTPPRPQTPLSETPRVVGVCGRASDDPV
jgi:hypothetical protein